MIDSLHGGDQNEGLQGGVSGHVQLLQVTQQLGDVSMGELLLIEQLSKCYINTNIE